MKSDKYWPFAMIALGMAIAWSLSGCIGVHVGFIDRGNGAVSFCMPCIEATAPH